MAPDSSPQNELDQQELRSGGLFRFLMNRLRNDQDAYDLAQEAYMRYFQVARAEVIHKPRSYLFRVAQNLVYEFRLRQSREREVLMVDSDVFDSEAGKVADPDNIDPSEALDRAQLVNRVLMQVPPGYRKVLIMSKRDGMSSAQIADTLGLSQRSVEKYLARALAYARLAVWK